MPASTAWFGKYLQIPSMYGIRLTFTSFAAFCRTHGRERSPWPPIAMYKTLPTVTCLRLAEPAVEVADRVRGLTLSHGLEACVVLLWQAQFVGSCPQRRDLSRSSLVLRRPLHRSMLVREDAMRGPAPIA